MRLFCFSLFLGDFAYLYIHSPLQPDFFEPAWILLSLFLLISVLTGLYLRSLNMGLLILVACCLGMLLAAEAWQKRLESSLHTWRDPHWVLITATVTHIPAKMTLGWSGEIATKTLCRENHCIPWQHHLRINDYSHNAAPLVGETWQWSVRIKPIHSWANPGMFAREQLDWYNGIDGNATVNKKVTPKLIQAAQGYGLMRFRASIVEQINHCAKNKPTIGLILGLLLGVRDQITLRQWQLVQATGTSHLLAISGLHIAMVAGLGYALMNFLWRRSAFLCCVIATPRVAWLFAFIVAAIYSALAGFAIPTVRALIMLASFALTQMGWRLFPKAYGLLLALMLVILWDPLAPLSPSFILSFAAVAVLTGVGNSDAASPHWRQLLRTQWVATIGLMPLTIWLFHQFSLVGFIANLIAIPWVGWLSVPLALAGLLLLPWPNLSAYLFYCADRSLDWLFLILEFLANLPFAVWHTVIPYTPLMWLAWLCVLILLSSPKRVHLIVALIALFGSLFVPHQKPKFGDVWVTVLDVGQGLSILVQTEHRVLVFDAGAKFPNGLDLGERIVLPVLRYYGWQQLDRLIISHGDNDHAGGANRILTEFPKTTLYTSVPDKFAGRGEFCHAGQHWRWDNVEFLMLHPLNEKTWSGNNASCILKINTQHHQIILPGDVEAIAEQAVVDYYPADFLKSTLLIAAHHGSRTSSIVPFIEKIHPEWVVFSTGFLNRFHFPNKLVVERYQQLGTNSLNTAEMGAIEFRFIGQTVEIKKQREKRCFFNLC